MRKLIILILSCLPAITQAQSPLCTSNPTNFCCEYVSSVTINGQTYGGSTGYVNTSGGSPAGYYDYTGGTSVPSITAGQNISISYTAQTNGNYMEYFKLWVDFNGNGVLSDAGEQVYAYNVAWTGTKTVTSTFQVPTSVFNGQVYMRFMMVYANIPALCGTYAYGNTFDFKTTITGAIDPFNYSGYVLGAENIGIPNIPVKLHKRLSSTAGTYSLHGTYSTGSDGTYNISTTLDANDYDFQIIIETLTIPSPVVADATFFNQNVIYQNFTGKDYYRMDTNGNGSLNITDVFITYKRVAVTGYTITPPVYRLFTETEWTTINSSSSNLTSTYPGANSITMSNLVSGDSTNIYLIRTGHEN